MKQKIIEEESPQNKKKSDDSVSIEIYDESYSDHSNQINKKIKKSEKKEKKTADKKMKNQLVKTDINIRRRNIGPDSKWTEEQHRKYCAFYAKQIIRDPYKDLSWYNWKQDGIFQKMSLYVGKAKQKCKSHDQQVKNKAGDMDIIDYIAKQLKNKEFLTFQDGNIQEQFCKAMKLREEFISRIVEHSEYLKQKLEQGQNYYWKE